MDSFTENILARARERQRLLQGLDAEPQPTSSALTSTSEPNLSKSGSPRKCPPKQASSTSEGNLLTSKYTTTHFTKLHSPSSPSLKTLNVRNDNFDMEIKVKSSDNVTFEVQIEEVEVDEVEQQESAPEVNEPLLRADARNRLNRLNKLYTDGDEADISSPIHRTEDKFHIDEGSPRSHKTSKKGLSKLADLAQNINEWEDDVTANSGGKRKNTTPEKKKSWKPPAPPPPSVGASVKNSPVKASPVKLRAPNPPVISPRKDVVVGQKSAVQWDKKVLDSLESQGFTRTDSSSRLVYKYDKESPKEKIVEEQVPKSKSPQKPVTPKGGIASRAAMFESKTNSPTPPVKDPALLSVSERKALFEKNKGTALVPKAAFAMAVPKSHNQAVKKVAAPLTPAVSIANKENEVSSNCSKVQKCAGIANTVAALFEGKSTISEQQIQKGVKEQRQKEMDVLLNRFHKADAKRDEVIIEECDSETTPMLTEKKVTIVPPAEQTDGESNEKRRSGGKRCTNKADSPKVVAVLSDVKRIKVSPKKKADRLYPSLTDIESATETENETEASPNSSFGESVSDSDANTSFGRDILREVTKGQTPQKRPILDDSTDMSDVVGDMDDDYIDEALAYNDALSGGPTPPKLGRTSPLESSTSFNYKKIQNTEFKSPMKITNKSPPRKTNPENLPSYVVDGNNLLPLTHTVSFYRKQQNSSRGNTPCTTPVKQIHRQNSIEENAEADAQEVEDLQEIGEKIRELERQVAQQENIISQTSQALNLCISTLEFAGSTEHVEAERVLLLATHRRQAALHELQRIKVENSLRPIGSLPDNVPLQKGSLTISKIILPMKDKYVSALAAAGGKGHHIVCLVRYLDKIYPTTLVSTLVNPKNPDFELKVPGVVKIDNIYSDFMVVFEVYSLQAQEEILPHDVKYHIKKPNTKSTPKKSKQDSLLSRPMKESPAGPNAVRSPSFGLIGYVALNIKSIYKKHWSLNNAPPMSPLQGSVEMSISCELTLSVEHRGFLTMFEDVSGFGAWHRRWCVLNGDTLSYWKYPDDERKAAPINSLSLKACVTKTVGPVSREICARLHTFLLETERTAYPSDKNSLIMVCKTDKTIIRHLLSADTKEDRVEWCNKLNIALGAIQIGL